uniref:Uncharacterized protein n=1 Tax=Anguilla anguilla TaxID=7936 RepID=A0A0E9X8E3_ANGAN
MSYTCHLGHEKYSFKFSVCCYALDKCKISLGVIMNSNICKMSSHPHAIKNYILSKTEKPRRVNDHIFRYVTFFFNVLS